MDFVRFCILIAIIGAGYTYLQERDAAHVAAALKSSSNENGFVSMPPVDGQDKRSVYVVAPQNCPSDAAKRAERLVSDLSRRGIPVVKADEVSFQFAGSPDKTTMNRINSMMKGPLPIVFVDGRASSNPSLELVVSEFNRSGRR